ncbi:MAG: SDR family NAD(P)-dependent oxidoreductase, partial [Comamonas sp.]
MDKNGLGGKTALVTGAGSGIGQHIATALAAHGVYVVLAGRQFSALRQTAEEIERSRGNCVSIATDVSDEASVKMLLEQTLQCTGDLPPASRTKLKLVKSVNHQENDGHEEEQIHRGANHRLPQTGR